MSVMIKIPNGLDYARHEMPQIAANTIPHFLNFIRNEQELPVKRIVIAVNRIKPTQSNLNIEKIKEYIERPIEELASIPFLISEEYRLIDGHHRWAAILNIDPLYQVYCYKIQCPIHKLISVSNTFEFSFTKNIVDKIVDG